MADNIICDILEDGTISISTESISDENHAAADQALDAINELMGGEVVRTKNRKAIQKMHAGWDVKRGGKITGRLKI